MKVFSIGMTEEGREMIAVAVSSEENLKHLDDNRARLAKLADPRTIRMDDAEADRLVAQATPVYYITGTIHSPETGAPTALMELAYRLAVDESPYIKEIRDGVVTLITPVVEVDGRDRIVDIYEWKKAHPNDVPPSARVATEQGAERLRRAMAVGDAGAAPGRRMVALTLLDGTTIRLPAKNKGEGAAQEGAAAPADSKRA